MTFSDDIGQALEDMYQGVSEVVQYTASEGAPATDLQIIETGIDDETVYSGSRIKSDVMIFEALVDGFTPQRGAVIVTKKGGVYTVKNFRYADPDHRIWLIECAKADE